VDRPDLQAVFSQHNTTPQTNPAVWWQSLEAALVQRVNQFLADNARTP
jgi:hypothetical protein